MGMSGNTRPCGRTTSSGHWESVLIQEPDIDGESGEQRQNIAPVETGTLGCHGRWQTEIGVQQHQVHLGGQRQRRQRDRIDVLEGSL
jgi:hypothetical protein